MNQPSFLKEIPCEFITLPIIKGKGDLCGIGKKWSLEQARQKLFDGYYISCCYYLKDTNYVVIDIDDPNYSLEQFYADTEIDSLYTVGNTKGFHVWLQMPKEKTDMFKKNLVKIGLPTAEIDFLGEKVFEKVGKEWFGDEPCFLYQEQMRKCFKEGTFEPKKKNTEVGESNSDIDLLKQLVELIAMEYCDNRDDWLKIVYAMKKCGFTEEEARNWSMKSDRYTEGGFESAWEQYSVDFITVSEGTIRFYAKKSNPTEYHKMTAKPFPTEPTDRDYAELFWGLKGDCCIVSNGGMYVFYKNQWRIIEKKEPHILRTMIGDTVREHFEKILKTVKDKDYISTLNNLKEICKTNKVSNVTRFVIDKMYSDHCDTEDIFDNKSYVFAFKNQAFDLQTGQPYNIKKEDYITQNTGYEYVKPTKEQMQTVKSVFKSIFPDAEVGKCYLSMLRMCLSGEHPEKLFLANGGGRNGKGLINELMFKLLGAYAYKLSIEVLTKDVKKTGANPELANMHKKRMVLSNEPEDGTKLQMGIIKEITGGNEISARGLYNGNTKTELHCVSVVECNKKPMLSGRMDTSVLERIVDIPFESTFVSNPDDVDESRGIFQGNTLYKTDAWQKEHASAMFHYILENAEKTLYIPQRIKNLSKQYVLGSDEMYGWVMENYEPATDFDKQFVKLKDMFDLYKASDLYSNLTKLEKRNLNKKAFSDLIHTHIVLKKQFRNNQTRIDGKKIDCERIHGLVLKVEECDTDDEDVGHQG